MNKNELARYGAGYRGGEPFDHEHNESEWKFFGTLSFRGSPSLRQAYGIYWPWFREPEEVEGVNRLNFVSVTECGSFPGKVRFHLLIGGSRIKSKWDWVLRWPELGGDEANLFYYRPGFFHYVLREAYDDSDLEISMAIGACLWIF